ncbi:hydrogenase maturation protease [Aestuariibacter halophilus]|uniref:Hydrogenase maturation protease n=1 Tax=Fluctibacter halophilus TaxID=226011 RepID=A0ABS8G4W0_9ALTE|nr:hydrogenase maturation protease [Aestuariibacter halophilus]MCC2615580.1 hydrogenase maturation protease [Aestuariibacter halophilus]
MSRVRIICIGNALHGNDGFGAQLFDRLQNNINPDIADCFDGGIGGLTLLPLFKGVSRVLLIDLVLSDAAPGSVKFYPDVLSGLPVTEEHGAEHGGDLTTLLAMLPVYLTKVPRVDLLCVTARQVRHFETELEPAVTGAIDTVLQQVNNYLERQLQTVDTACQQGEYQ